jgi:hypothetical protein
MGKGAGGGGRTLGNGARVRVGDVIYASGSNAAAARITRFVNQRYRFAYGTQIGGTGAGREVVVDLERATTSPRF